MEIDAYGSLNTSNLTTSTQNVSSFNNNASLFDTLIANNTQELDSESAASQGLASFSQDLAILNQSAKEAVKSLKDDSSQSSDSSNTHDELSLILELRRLQAS
ncbi:MAG: hypothetical protein HRT43_13355 [Campylobacteraceae bacterium]|nr:hypothetical protein [Campylobacteraceae bacterium]